MNEESLINTIKELVAIPSTADNPAGLHEAYSYLYEMVRASGKDITIEPFESNGIPSFLAYRGETRPEKFHLILNGHVDVVSADPELFQPYVADGNIYGRGTYDMKAAAVILTEVFCGFVDKVPYALGLQIVCDEESSGRHGTQYQIAQGVRSDFVVCGESGRAPGIYEIANEAKGICNFVVKFSGIPTHGAYPWRGDNPGIKAVNFTAKLHGLYPTPEEDATDRTTAALISIVSHSDSHSRTPSEALARFDTRYIAGDPTFTNKETVRAFVERIDPEAEIIEFTAFSAPLQTQPTNSLLLDLKAAAEHVEHHEFKFARRNATSDGRHYGEVGDEACEFGITGVGQHADIEYISLQDCFHYRATMREFLSKTIESEHHNRNKITG